jgi:hypothetical protein
VTYSSTVLADSPIAYWRLGESSGTSAVAAVGPNGTYQNSPTLGVAGFLTGDSNTAVTFARASAQGVGISTGMPAGVAAGYSVEMWTNMAAISVDGQEHTLWSADQINVGANIQLRYRYFSGPDDYLLYWWFWDGTQRTVNVANFLTSNALGGGRHHLVVTHDFAGKSAKVYVDGALNTTTSLAAFGTVSTLAANASSRIAGYMGNDLTNASGTLDEVAIYNAVLTLGQVSAHYTAGITAPVTVVTGQHFRPRPILNPTLAIEADDEEVLLLVCAA